MFIYNITVKVENDIAEAWIQWQKEIHIPQIMATGFFYDHRLYKLLEQDESDGQTFVVQFFALELNDYEEYIRDYAPELRQQSFRRWGNKFVAFRTLLSAI